jgi:alanine racemase
VGNDAVEQKFLQNVGTLKTVILQIKQVPAGDSVGYGRRFMAKQPVSVATLPVGYADGIRRAWGNGKGYVTIAAKPVY